MAFLSAPRSLDHRGFCASANYWWLSTKPTPKSHCSNVNEIQMAMMKTALCLIWFFSSALQILIVSFPCEKLLITQMWLLWILLMESLSYSLLVSHESCNIKTGSSFRRMRQTVTCVDYYIIYSNEKYLIILEVLRKTWRNTSYPLIVPSCLPLC